MSGKAWAIVLDQYNEVTIKVGNSEGVKVIDLANLLPKNSLYYYDAWHYTIKGNEKVSEILAKELIPYFEANRKINKK